MDAGARVALSAHFAQRAGCTYVAREPRRTPPAQGGHKPASQRSTSVCLPAVVLEAEPAELRRFRAGDPATLHRVYSAYRDDVYRLVRRGFLVKGPSPMHIPGLTDPALQDTVQEVFAKAFAESARLSYDGVRPYRPFLLQIAKNVRIDQERRAWREVPLDDSMLPSYSAYHADDVLVGHPHFCGPEEILDWERRRRAAVGYLERLDPESQQFAVLRFVEELSQNEVAAQMSVTRRRARTLENRLLVGLRRYFQKERLG
jgi:RNA polymerase sigma factor (sigma-70 family)